MQKNGGLGQYSNYSVAATVSTVSTHIMPGTLTKPVEPADRQNGGMAECGMRGIC